jgi:hypothetical protein
VTSLVLVTADQLGPGDRFRFAGADHDVTSIEQAGTLLNVHVDDRPAPVTLFPHTTVILIRVGVS